MQAVIKLELFSVSRRDSVLCLRPKMNQQKALQIISLTYNHSTDFLCICPQIKKAEIKVTKKLCGFRS